MKLGKTIRLYLMDGAATGPIAAEIINWTGLVVLAPRAQLHELAGREELKRTGIYMLIGQDDETSRDKVYIGEADEVFKRLKQHDSDPNKEFWSRAMAVTSKDFNLTKAHARYLESRLIELATGARRALIANNTAPETKSLPESDRADMEYFLQQLQLVLPVLGIDLLRPRVSVDAQQASHSDSSPMFVMEQVGISAKAREVDGKFVVLAGSIARVDGTESWTHCRELREELVASGVLVEADGGTYRFEEDYEFNSPSAAAATVVAGNRNGRVVWKVESSGQTYAEWKEQQIEAAELAAGSRGA